MKPSNEQIKEYESRFLNGCTIGLHPKEFAHLQSTVGIDDFAVPIHGYIWKAWEKVYDYDRFLQVRHTTLELMNLGGVNLGENTSEAIAAIYQDEPMHANDLVQAAIYIHEIANFRRLDKALKQAQHEISKTVSFVEAVALTQEKIETVLNADSEFGRVSKNERIDQTMQDIINLRDGGITPKVKTSFDTLDAMLGGGLRQNDLVVIAAQQKMGKTTFQVNTMLNICARLKPDGSKPFCLFFSAEMTATDIERRLVSAMSQVPINKVDNPMSLSDHELAAVMESYQDIKWLNYEIVDTSAMSVAQIEYETRRFHSRYGIDCIFIDHLNRLAYPDPRMQEYEGVSKNIQAIKNLAKRYECPVVCAVQLNRFDPKKDKISTDRLRGSGRIAEEADRVIFMVQSKDNDKLIEFHMTENRHGEKGTCYLELDGTIASFTEREVKVIDLQNI